MIICMQYFKPVLNHLYIILLSESSQCLTKLHIRPIRVFAFLLCIPFLSDCSLLSPMAKLKQSTLVQSHFKHRVVESYKKSRYIHVYIEGDGRPWRTRTSISADPSPRNPLMLRLMTLDTNHTLYIGRPCYYQTNDKKCTPNWWTNSRYGNRVVKSMNRVLDLHLSNDKEVVLIGHSGGGTLAMLMAAQRQDVVAVVTLAGNLNVAAWASHHNYSPLVGSLDPAALPQLDQNIKQLHFLGAKDHTILKSMLQPVIDKQHNAKLVELADVSHSCCWETKCLVLCQNTYH